MMVETLKLPFNDEFVKQLTSETPEKQISALCDLNKLIHGLIESEKIDEVQSLINYLSRSFALSQIQTFRVAGLCALMNASASLRNRLCDFKHLVLPPLLANVNDPSTDVRLLTLKVLSNCTLLLGSDGLFYFKELFDIICREIDHIDSKVRSAALNMSNVLMDIIIREGDVNVSSLIPPIQERLYSFNCNAVHLVLHWVR
ncbi:hypothetical protein ACOME3_005838 [Neoechinorhynchus agilis]